MNRFSVIIPFYRDVNRLSKLIKSLKCSYLNSTGSYLVEIIIINDSPDVELNEKMYPFLKSANGFTIVTIVNQGNIGVANSRNRGRAYADGEYITFIDQDDLVSIDYFKVIFESLKSGSDLYILNGYRLWELDDIFIRKQPFFLIKVPFNYFNFIKTNFIHTPGQVVFRNNFLVDRFKSYDNINTGTDDWALYLDITSTKKFSYEYVTEKVFFYITHDTNESKDRYKLLNSAIVTLEQHQPKEHKKLINFKLYVLKKLRDHDDMTLLGKIFYRAIDRIIRINLNSCMLIIHSLIDTFNYSSRKISEFQNAKNNK